MLRNLIVFLTHQKLLWARKGLIQQLHVATGELTFCLSAQASLASMFWSQACLWAHIAAPPSTWHFHVGQTEGEEPSAEGACHSQMHHLTTLVFPQPELAISICE